jgi:hypothetical protein
MGRKFGDPFVNSTIVFERALPLMFEDEELQESQPETVRTSPTCVMIDSLRIWRDVDSFYGTIDRSKQSIQVRKLMCLVKTGGSWIRLATDIMVLCLSFAHLSRTMNLMHSITY